MSSNTSQMTPEARANHTAAVEKLRDAFRWLEKSLRSFTIYSAKHTVAQKFREELGAKFSSIPEELGDTWVELRAKAMAYGQTDVYREDIKVDGFAFRMHRDGIRRLCFQHGLDTEEVARFAEALWVDLEDPEFFDSDMVTLLWEADLEHIRYIVAELMAEDTEDEEELKRFKELMNDIIATAMNAALPPGYQDRQVDQLIRITTQAIANIKPEHVAAALALAEDTGSVETYQGQNIEPWVEVLQSEYDDPAVLQKFAEILHRGILQANNPAEAPALGTFDLLLQAMVQHQRYADLTKVMEQVYRLGTRNFPSMNASEKMLSCILNKERIETLVRNLVPLEDEDCQDIFSALRYVPLEGCAPMLSAGATLENQDKRKVLVKIVAKISAKQPGILSKHLKTKNLIENQMATQALRTIGTEEALESLAPLSQHPDVEMRLTLLRATLESNSANIRKIRLALLDDQNARVRAEAEQSLARHRDPELVERLYHRLQNGHLLAVSMVEKRRACEILGTNGTKREIQALSEFVNKSHRLHRQKYLELCAAAAYGLAASGNPIHAPMLEAKAAHWFTAKLVRNACKDASAILRGEKKSGKEISQVRSLNEISKVRPLPNEISKAKPLPRKETGKNPASAKAQATRNMEPTTAEKISQIRTKTQSMPIKTQPMLANTSENRGPTRTQPLSSSQSSPGQNPSPSQSLGRRMKAQALRSACLEARGKLEEKETTDKMFMTTQAGVGPSSASSPSSTSGVNRLPTPPRAGSPKKGNTAELEELLKGYVEKKDKE